MQPIKHLGGLLKNQKTEVSESDTKRRRIMRGVDWWYFRPKQATQSKIIAKKHDFLGGDIFSGTLYVK